MILYINIITSGRILLRLDDAQMGASGVRLRYRREIREAVATGIGFRQRDGTCPIQAGDRARRGGLVMGIFAQGAATRRNLSKGAVRALSGV